MRSAIVVLGKSADDCTRAMDHLATKIVVRSAANSAETWLAASRVLSRDQPYPSCQFSPGFEVTSVLNASDECCCDDRTDAWQFGQTATIFPLAANFANLRIEPSDPVVHIGELVEQLRK